MTVWICMPTGEDGIQNPMIIYDALLTVVNRIALVGETSGEFAADDKKNMVTFEVTE